jgi:hypothetical protein
MSTLSPLAIYAVVGGDFEERGRRIGALDADEPIGDFPDAGIAAFAPGPPPAGLAKTMSRRRSQWVRCYRWRRPEG